MTWNLWGRMGPWEQRREAIAATLDALRPDAVGLQEVWGYGGENLAEWLAERLGMHHVWEPADTPEGRAKRRANGEADIGNAVLSRWPVAAHEVRRLPTAGTGDEGRIVLHAMLEGPGHRVPFFTTHLNYPTHESAVRCRQVRALAEFVAERRGDGPFPPVVTGDFNAWPDSDEMRLLGGFKTAPAVPELVLMDAWEYADPAAPSTTWEAPTPYITPSRTPKVRLDYIYVGLPGPGGLGHVRSVRRAGEEPVAGVWPTDHFAVVADLASEPGGGT